MRKQHLNGRMHKMFLYHTIDIERMIEQLLELNNKIKVITYNSLNC